MMITYQLERNDYYKFGKFVSTRVRAERAKPPKSPAKRQLFRIIFFLLLGMSIILLRELLKDQFNFEFHAYTFAAGLIIGIYLQIAYVIHSSKRMMPWHDGMVLSRARMIVDEAGIETQQENWDTMTRWPGVFDVKETKTHFFLMLDNCAGHTVPKSAFADANQLNEFRSLLAAHAVPAA